MAKNDQCNTGETDWVTDKQQAMLSFQEIDSRKERT